MSFRHNPARGSWTSWKQKHRDIITVAGLPEAFFESEKIWWGFLEHGCYDYWPPSENPYIWFKLEDLTSGQKDAIRVLIRETPGFETSVVAQWLKREEAE